MKQVFITGISRGFGQALAKATLAAGGMVYGLSRSGPGYSAPNLHTLRLDLADLERIPPALDTLIGDAAIDLVILNAGLLGEFKTMPELGLSALRRIMDVNVWANKIILDWFAAHKVPHQVVLISSGASINGHKGWGAYALSKATLNMLAQLYAHDLPKAHLAALAPGLIHTKMQDYISEKVDATRFPSVARLKQARGTPDMPEPDIAARRILDLIPTLPDRIASGGFIDIRQL